MGALASIATAGAAKTGSRFPGSDYDVVVIGGGFAGIAAARDCRKNGFSTLVLEARNRLGGRTFTSEFEGHRVELGGAWIHWSQPFVWAEKERYGLEVVETSGFAPEKILVRVDDTVRALGEAEVGAVLEAFRTYTADARAILERPYEIRHSWESALRADSISARRHLARLELSPLQRAAMDSFIAGVAHNTPDQIAYFEALRWSALAGYGDLLLWMDAVGRFKFKDGTAGAGSAEFCCSPTRSTS